MSLHDISVTTIDGQEQSLSDYKGKVLLVVNTASECGSTPQYKGLEELWRAYKDRGFVVLGFPSNDFGGQEPLDEAGIKAVCAQHYDVTVPMSAKVKTQGEGQSLVYRVLSADWGEPKWNVHKYLVGKTGRVIKSVPTRTEPSNAALRAAIETALK